MASVPERQDESTRGAVEVVAEKPCSPSPCNGHPVRPYQEGEGVVMGLRGTAVVGLVCLLLGLGAGLLVPRAGSAAGEPSPSHAVVDPGPAAGPGPRSITLLPGLGRIEVDEEGNWTVPVHPRHLWLDDPHRARLPELLPLELLAAVRDRYAERHPDHPYALNVIRHREDGIVEILTGEVADPQPLGDAGLVFRFQRRDGDWIELSGAVWNS